MAKNWKLLSCSKILENKAISFRVRPYAQVPPDGNSNAYNVIIALQ